MVMEKRVVLQVNDTKLHLVLGKTVKEWDETWGNEEDCLWDILFEELLDGTIDINENIWYWYIDGRCYETYEDACD